MNYPTTINTSVLETLKEGFMSIDQKWQVKYWNRQAEEFTRIKKDNIVGRALWDVFPLKKHQAFFDEYTKAWQTNEAVQFKAYSTQLKKTFSVTAHPSKKMLHVAFLDITPILHLEEQKIASELRYDIVAHATESLCWDVDLKTQKLTWHGSRLKELLGYEKNGVFNNETFWNETLHPADKIRVLKKLVEAVKTNVNEWEDEYRLRTIHGKYIYVRNRARLYKKGMNGKVRMIGCVTDISEKKKLEKKLLGQQKDIWNLFYRSPLPQWIYSRQSLRFLDVNKAAIDMYGYSKVEFLNMTPFDIRSEPAKKRLKVFLRTVRDNVNPARTVSEHITRHGEKKLVEVHSASLPFMGEDVRIVTIRDLTDQVGYKQRLRLIKKENEVALAEAAVEAGDRIKERMGQELHDNINQILASTKLYIDFAQGNEALRFETLQQAKANLDLAIREIRELSRAMVVPQASDIDLEKMIRKIVGDLKKYSGIHAKLEIPEGINNWPYTYKLNLFRIVQEATQNIVKYASAGEVTIRLSCEEDVQFLIRDNGMGFEVAKKTPGIGLMNMASRANALHGRFSLKSAPGHGTEIQVMLPLP